MVAKTGKIVGGKWKPFAAWSEKTGNPYVNFCRAIRRIRCADDPWVKIFVNCVHQWNGHLSFRTVEGRITLRAAHLLADNPERRDELDSAHRLAGSRGVEQWVRAAVGSAPKRTLEEALQLAREARKKLAAKRRIRALETLQEHRIKLHKLQSQLKRQEKIVAKWQRKVRAHEKEKSHVDDRRESEGSTRQGAAQRA